MCRCVGVWGSVPQFLWISLLNISLFFSRSQPDYFQHCGNSFLLCPEILSLPFNWCLRCLALTVQATNWCKNGFTMAMLLVFTLCLPWSYVSFLLYHTFCFVMIGEAPQEWRPCCSISFYLEHSPSFTSLFSFSEVNPPMVLLPIEFCTGFDKVWRVLSFWCLDLVCIHWVENVPETPIVTLVLKIHMVRYSTCIQCFPWNQVPNTIGTHRISSLSTPIAIPHALDNMCYSYSSHVLICMLSP